jgi:hypothetical protein
MGGEGTGEGELGRVVEGRKNGMRFAADFYKVAWQPSDPCRPSDAFHPICTIFLNEEEEHDNWLEKPIITL